MTTTNTNTTEWQACPGLADVPVSWTPAIGSLMDLLVNDCDGRLTTDHAASSHGLPVVVRSDGTALGAAEVRELTVTIYSSLGHAALTAQQRSTIDAARSVGYVIRCEEP